MAYFSDHFESILGQIRQDKLDWVDLHMLGSAVSHALLGFPANKSYVSADEKSSITLTDDELSFPIILYDLHDDSSMIH